MILSKILYSYVLMRRNKNIIPTLLIFALLYHTTLSCIGANPLDLMQTGTVILKQAINKLDHKCFSVAISYQTPDSGFQTAVSFSKIDTINELGYNLAVKGGQSALKINELQISFLTEKNIQWNQIQVSYLVTSRNDLYAGSFLTDSFGKFSNCQVQNSGSQTFQIEKTYVSGISPKITYKVQVFLSGIDARGADMNLNLKLLDPIFDSDTGLLSVRGEANAYPYLRSIRVSYIIYQTTASFTMNEFSQSVDYSFTYSSNLEKGILKMNQLKFDFDRLTCIGRNCDKSCVRTEQCKNGVIQDNKNCLMCGRNEKIQSNSCIPNCKVNEDYDTKKDECNCKPGFARQKPESECSWTCGQNQEWKNQCVCKEYFAKYDGRCIACPQHSKFSKHQCICQKDYFWLPHKLACQYLQPCTENSSPQLIDGQWVCQCNTNYYMIDQSKTCQYVAPCPANSIVKKVDNIWKCVCQKDYFWIESKYQCQNLICPSNSDPTLINDKWECICKKDYYLNIKQGSCDYLAPCPSHSKPLFVDEVLKCVCDKDYYYLEESQSCQYVAPCPQKSKAQLIGKEWKCVCLQNNYWIQSKYQCQSLVCQMNSDPKLNGDKWQCFCRQNYYFNAYSKTCDYLAPCPINSSPGFVENVAKCICNQNYHWNIKKQICQFVAPCQRHEIIQLIEDSLKCICDNHSYLSVSKNSCQPLPDCPVNSKFNLMSEECDCVRTAQKLSNGVCRPPVKFEVYDNQKRDYVCIVGYKYLGTRCVKVCTQFEDQLDDGCVCKPNCYKDGLNCVPCPQKSLLIPGTSTCVCQIGFAFDAYGKCGKIVEKCPEGTSRQPSGACTCKAGTYFDQLSNTCKSLPLCPQRSKWVQSKLRCECTKIGEYLIGNVCQTCKSNQFWNGKECVCLAGYYKLDGKCFTCAENAKYDGINCVCNNGYSGNGRIQCQKCHETCGKCVGSQFDQCLTCFDATLSLEKKLGKQYGTCIKSICPPGHYQLQDSQNSGENLCTPCSAYCVQCISQQICNKCVSGFEPIQYKDYNVVVFSYCTEICGDGKRFQYDCDDGNKVDGDGCNSDCQVQDGYVCEGGSSIRPDVCKVRGSQGSIISLTGSLTLVGKVMQGVRISNLPALLTQKDCQQCAKLLLPRIISSPVIPKIEVTFVPYSKYQYIIGFDFGSMHTIPVFTISIQINPDYSKYFSAADLAQIEVKTIDPSVLSMNNDEKELTVDFI